MTLLRICDIPLKHLQPGLKFEHPEFGTCEVAYAVLDRFFFWNPNTAIMLTQQLHSHLQVACQYPVVLDSIRHNIWRENIHPMQSGTPIAISRFGWERL